jgi:rSAM/selenodomain-associated transferase 1
MPAATLEPARVAILAKAPIAGAVKTRLVPLLGAEGAAALQERLIHRTVETAIDADIGPVTLWGSPDETHPLFRALAARFGVALRRQPEGDLGARMHAAIALRCPAIVIGADCPALTPAHLRTAADVLRDGQDAVIFPAEDGGYVLIGLRQPHAALFAPMEWGTDAVLAETRRRLVQLALSWREPVSLWDVDRPADIERLRREGLAELLPAITTAPRAHA